MATSYADSAQAREWDRRYDAWGREKKSRPDEFHDYEADEKAHTQAQVAKVERQAKERASLKLRIASAISQMEMVCPPVEAKHEHA